ASEASHALGEAVVPTHAIDAQLPFLVHQIVQRGTALAAMAHPEAQRSAVNRKPFDVVEMQSVSDEERHQAVKRMVEVVLMVNRVELAFLDHVDGVGDLEYRDAVEAQELGEAGNEI